ncbi:hypothetical protein Sros01_78230 [Streptomyces roseochromogenus]|nr:hypothetical protein Sros01_78230 [Streptomyces roseochromogenus]
MHPSCRGTGSSRPSRATDLSGTPITETDEDGDTWVVGVEARQSLGHATTIVINHIALFIAEADSETLHTDLVTTLDATGTATQLWPDPRAFKWPLSPTLTPDQIDDIGDLTQPLPSTATG